MKTGNGELSLLQTPFALIAVIADYGQTLAATPTEGLCRRRPCRRSYASKRRAFEDEVDKEMGKAQ